MKCRVGLCNGHVLLSSLNLTAILWETAPCDAGGAARLSGLPGRTCGQGTTLLLQSPRPEAWSRHMTQAKPTGVLPRDFSNVCLRRCMTEAGPSVATVLTSRRLF